MSDHYDGVSEPMSRAEKEAMRRDEADYDALAARLAEAERLLREVRARFPAGFHDAELSDRICAFLRPADRESGVTP